MRNTSFNQWITNLSVEEMYVDKLTLFSLSWLYKQHTVVITKNKLWSTLHSNSPVNEEALLDVCSVKLVYLGQLRFGTLRPKMAVPDFVMVPVAAGGPTKPTASYQSMQSQPMSKPSTVSVPKSKTVPGTGISLVKGEKTAADEPLPVETLPVNNELNPNLSAKDTENVETKGSEHVTEHVATETDVVTSQVETVLHIQNTAHVETSPSEETSTYPSASLPTEANGTATEHSTSETPTNLDSSNTGENGAVKEVADSSMEIEKDTSTQNLESPKTPVANLDDEVKTDAYSDDETIANTDDDTQIPDINAKVIDTGNDAVETSTNLMLSLEMTEKTAEPDSKSVVLKKQPLNDIKIDIWRNTVDVIINLKQTQHPRMRKIHLCHNLARRTMNGQYP